MERAVEHCPPPSILVVQRADRDDIGYVGRQGVQLAPRQGPSLRVLGVTSWKSLRACARSSCLRICFRTRSSKKAWASAMARAPSDFIELVGEHLSPKSSSAKVSNELVGLVFEGSDLFRVVRALIGRCTFRHVNGVFSLKGGRACGPRSFHQTDRGTTRSSRLDPFRGASRIRRSRGRLSDYRGAVCRHPDRMIRRCVLIPTRADQPGSADHLTASSVGQRADEHSEGQR